MVKHELNEIQKSKTKGAILRSGANWTAHGEMPTKYFLNLEKKRAQKKTLHRVINEEGKLVEMEFEVLKVIKQYYQKLYETKGPIDKSYIEKLVIPQISDENHANLDRDLEDKEVSIALNQLKNSPVKG